MSTEAAMIDTQIEKAEIAKLIGSAAYQKSNHPDSRHVRQYVTNWFAKTYFRCTTF